MTSSPANPSSDLPAGPLTYSFPCVTAQHVPHVLPRYADNPLIGALNYPSDSASLKRKLTYIPEFTEDMRRLDRSTRRLHLQELKRFRLGLPRLCELAELTHGTMLESYVGRVPHSPSSIRRLSELYRHRGTKTLPLLPENGAEFAGAMIGKGGCGKTFAMNAVAALYSGTPVIHHPKLSVWQIPMVKLAMPYLGASRKALATALIHEIDRLFPDGNYARLHLAPKTNSNQLLLSAFALLQIHCVGYVFVDDSGIAATLEDDPISKMDAPHEKKTPLTTLLIAMSNQAGVPLLFSGTPELRQILGKTNSLLRRSTGQPWGPLLSISYTKGPSEFDMVLGLLWTLQLLQQPKELTERMRELFLFYSYAIPDTLVKLFMRVQMRALFEGLETITEELVHRVALQEMHDVVEVAVAHHEMDRTGARDKLMRMCDLRAEYAPDGASKGEFGRPNESAWSLEQAVQRYFSSDAEDAATSQAEKTPTVDGASAVAQPAPPRTTMEPALPEDASKPAASLPRAAVTRPRKRRTKRADGPARLLAGLDSTKEANWSEVGT